MKLKNAAFVLPIFLISVSCAKIKVRFSPVKKSQVVSEPVFADNEKFVEEVPASIENQKNEEIGNSAIAEANEPVPKESAIQSSILEEKSQQPQEELTQENPKDPEEKSPMDELVKKIIEEKNPTGMEVDLLCSNKRSNQIGYNLKTAEKPEIQVIDESGAVICRNADPSLKDQIINNRLIPHIECPEAQGLNYRVRFVDAAKEDKGLKIKNGKVSRIRDMINFDKQAPLIIRAEASEPFILKSASHIKGARDKIEILYDANNGPLGSDPLCDRRASPLVIKTEPDDHSGIHLTPPNKGVRFDILGENSNKRPHSKKKISWITKASYMFLAKPDANGEINGINELFGDNTKGPDGDFAKDGYAALAKYDLNKDSVIDEKDAVFTELRLWSDKNLNGKASDDELISLVEQGVEAIDLNYDDSFLETDQYGNQTKMKSAVKYVDGSYRLIFDLWFNYEGKRRR